MIHLKNTPNYTGVTIYGDYFDFESLYDSLHTIIGEEGEWESYEGARLRVLGVCYDLRHSIMGDREVGFVGNGFGQDKMRRLSIVTNDKNTYLGFNVFWPELLFVTMALNDFVRLYANKQAKKHYNAMLDYRNIWDEPIAHVRSLQAAIATCIKDTIPKTSSSRILKLMNFDYTWTDHYVTQYIDELNCKFIRMNKGKRQKNISIMAKRIAEKGPEYKALKDAVLEASRKYECHMTELRTEVEYPETFEW